jgi:hypothetical protein
MLYSFFSPSASWHLLVSQNVHRFTIQAVRVTVNDLNILSILPLPFQVGNRGPLQQRGAVLVDSIEPVKQIFGQGD